MSVEWDSYRVVDLSVDLRSGFKSRLNELSRAAAERIFSDLMERKEERKALLKKLLRANGLELSCAEEELLALNDWMCRNASCREDNIHDVTPVWYSVGIDAALYLGDCMIGRAPHLRWELCTDPPDHVAYHMPVIVGFQNCKEEFDVDLIRPAVAIARRGLLYNCPEEKLEKTSDLAKPSYYRRLRKYKERDEAGESLDRTLVKLLGVLEYA